MSHKQPLTVAGQVLSHVRTQKGMVVWAVLVGCSLAQPRPVAHPRR